MSQTLINRSHDLGRLRDEGYAMQIKAGASGVLLLIHKVPYVNSKCEVQYGTLVSPLTLNSDITMPPDNHQAWFIGEHPCNKDGSEIFGIKHQSMQNDFGGGVIANHGFSTKLRGGIQYPDYHAKMTRYIDIIEAPAQAIQPGVSAKTFDAIESADLDTVFNYFDTASSRAGIGKLSEKFSKLKIGIIGLGGTGTYVLDLVAKTHVAEIHLFDADIFSQHNAFRSPGAPAIGQLTNPLKVDYFFGIYSKMRKGIIPHAEKITQENLNLITSLDFIFICIDNGFSRKLIVDELRARSVPFIDVGLDVQISKQGELMGMVRTTLCTNNKNDHADQRLSYTEAQHNDLYISNIQVAELNALNATMAVIKWKKYVGFYLDEWSEHDSVYTISTQCLTKDERA
jgi:hypothetical protein